MTTSPTFFSLFKNLPANVMTPETTETFLRLSFLEQSDTEHESPLWSLTKYDAETPVPLKMVLGHAAARGLHISAPAAGFLALGGILDTPAHIAMYTQYLSDWQKQNPQEITLNVLGLSIFPNGFPSVSDLNDLWNNLGKNGISL